MLTEFIAPDCRRIAMMKPDLSVVPRSSLEVRQSPDGEFYRVEYTLEMSFDTVISFRLRHNGEIKPFETGPQA
jgi:hypothetical protein